MSAPRVRRDRRDTGLDVVGAQGIGEIFGGVREPRPLAGEVRDADDVRDPIGAALERAAVLADPLLLLLLLMGATIFVARQFGAWPAAFLALGAVMLFPFGVGFLPGAPDDPGLGQVAICWSVLLLLAGVQAAHATVASADHRARRWFFLGGIAGGFGA